METLALRIIDYPDAETSPDHPNQWPCKGCWSYAGPTGLSVVARRIEGGPALTRRPGFEYPFEAGYSIRQSARFPDTNGYRQLFHTGGQHYHIHTHAEGVGVGDWAANEGWLSFGYCRKIDLVGEKPYSWTGVYWATNTTVWRPVFLRFTWLTATNTMRVEVSIGNTTPSADHTYELAHDPTGSWDGFERPVATDGILQGWFSYIWAGPSWGPDFRDNDSNSRFAGALRPPMPQLPKIGQDFYSSFDMLDRWLPEGGLHDLSAGAYAHQWAENINGGPDVNLYSYTGLRIFRNDAYYNGTLNKFGFVLSNWPDWEGYYTADIPDTYVLMDASNDNTITLSLQSTNYGTPPASISYRWRKLGDQLPPSKTAADYAATDEIILGDHDGESLRLPKKLTCSLTGLQHLSSYPATDVNAEGLDDYPWMVDDVPPLLWTQSTSPYGEMAGAWTHNITHLVASVETDLRRVPWYQPANLVAHAAVRVQIVSTNADANGDSYRIVSEIPCSLFVLAAQFDPLHISIEWVPPYADAPYSAGWRYILYQAEVARGDSLTSIPNSITASEAGHYDLTAMTVHIGYGGSLTLSS